jgi:hypothetical protein
MTSKDIKKAVLTTIKKIVLEEYSKALKSRRKKAASKPMVSENKKTVKKNSFLKEATDIQDDDVNELIMFAENDRACYDALHKNYVPALNKFIKKGNFDRDKAIKLMEYYYSNYVRPAYKKQFGDIQLNPAKRKMFGNYFLETLEEEGYIDTKSTTKQTENASNIKKISGHSARNT